MPASSKRVAEVSLFLEDAVDGIATNAGFNKLLTIQRCRKATPSTVITLIDIAYNKLTTTARPIEHHIDRIAPNVAAAIAFSPVEDNRFASTTTAGKVLIWDLERRKVTKRYNCTDKYTPLQFHRSDPNIFAVIGPNEAMQLIVHDIRAHPTTVPGVGNNFCTIADFAFGQHPDNKDTIAAVGEDGNIKLWDIRHMKKPMIPVIPAHRGYTFSVAFSKNERNLLVTGGIDKFVRVWSYEDSAKEEFAVETPSAVGKVVWTNESRYHVCSSSVATSNRENGDHNMYLWDVRRSNLPYRCFDGHSSPITDMIFPNDSSIGMCISASDDGVVVLHRVDQATIPMASVDVVSITCSGNSNEVAFVVPAHEANLDPAHFCKPKNFAKPILSNVFTARIAEPYTETERFKYLAQRYKLTCPLRESLKDLCKYNSAVCKAIHDYDTAKSWELLGLIADDDIISSIRPDLGKQFRTKKNFKHGFSSADEDDLTPLASEHEASLHFHEDDFVEFSDLEEPDNEFVYEQEFFDFAVVLEEENCIVAGNEEVTPYRVTKKKNAFAKRVVNREQWFTGLNRIKLPSYNRRARSKTVKRFKGALGRRFRGVSFANPQSDTQVIKRTCVGYVFDNARAELSDFTSSGSTGTKGPLSKFKFSYNRRMSDRRAENNFPRPAQAPGSDDEDEAVKRKRLEKRQREKCLAWVADNRILAPARAPVTEIHRIIMDRAREYRDEQFIALKKEEKQAGTKPADKKQNNFNPTVEYKRWPLLQLLFEHYRRQDDVQMFSCMAMCIGERVTMVIPERQVDRCFYYYTEQLDRCSLFKEATVFMKANFRMQISQLNAEDNFISHICEKCNQPLKGSTCQNKKCRHQHSCNICHRAVYGQRLLCLDCGHGGHPDHVHEWFEKQGVCPVAGCKHNCFPKVPHYQGILRNERSSTRFHTTSNMLTGDEREAIHWRYKVPPC
uniref:GATOR2 complex protein WDR24 n=1 Tax=Panagrellus redivivus TaxID=6233 RepID=A0A7E4VYQ8_PANRE